MKEADDDFHPARGSSGDPAGGSDDTTGGHTVGEELDMEGGDGPGSDTKAANIKNERSKKQQQQGGKKVTPT